MRLIESEKGRDCLLDAKTQNETVPTDTAKLELYRLIGEGYKAIQDGRTSTLEEVREKLKR